MPLTIGFSPCPNDTHIFYGLVHGKVDLGELEFAPPVLEDVETLNEWAMAGRLDVTKLSFHALGHVLDRYVLLNVGAALGRGCGPLLVSGEPCDDLGDLAGARIAIPGKYTTAALLMRLFAPECGQLVPMRFDAIMPAIKAGRVAAGVIIHESRFTYAGEGLFLVRDLGDWWEETTGRPIPLGGIAARRSLGRERLRLIEGAVRASVAWSFAHPDQGLAYVRAHAQELDDRVVAAHIGLYVNRSSLDLGAEGIGAVRAFLARGVREGILPEYGEEGLLID